MTDVSVPEVKTVEAKPIVASPQIQKIREADSALSSWHQRDRKRQEDLAEAKAAVKPTTNLEKPEVKDDNAKLGEQIKNEGDKVSGVCDKAFIYGAEKDQADLASLKTELLNARRSGEEPDPVTLARVISFAEKNAGARRSWENTADILQKYPEALQWDSLRGQILGVLKQEVSFQGPLELAKPAEQRILDLLLQNEGMLNEADRKEVQGWKSYVEGNSLFGQVEKTARKKQNTLNASEVSAIPGVNFDAGAIQRAMSELKLPFVIPDNFGQVVARLSKTEGISDEAKDELRMRTLGYSEAVLAKRPPTADMRRGSSEESRYIEASVSVARAIAELAGPDQIVNDLRRGGDQFSNELGKVWDKINSSDADRVFREQNAAVVTIRDEKREKETEGQRKQEEASRKQAREQIEEQTKIDKQRYAAGLLTNDMRIRTNLEALTNRSTKPPDRQKALDGLQKIAKDPNDTTGSSRLAVEMALQVVQQTSQLRTDYSPTGAQQRMLGAVNERTGVFASEQRWRLTSRAATTIQAELTEIQASEDFKNANPATIARYRALQTVSADYASGYWAKDKSGQSLFHSEGKK